MKFFYIIQFDGCILELKYTESMYKNAMNALHRGGVAVLMDNNGEPMTFNAGAIAKILTENQYESYIDSVQPRAYIRAGEWRDNKGRIIRYEPWRKKQIEETKKIEQKPDPDEKQKVQKIANMMKDKKNGLLAKIKTYE